MTTSPSPAPRALSVLDLIPVRQGQTTGQALAASKELVETADQFGFTRYWVAEHHNMPAVASTTPGTLLMHLGQTTARIRLGSGGVMLPNHAPLAVAEQFALLSAVYGDRVDLGIGRAPGTDPFTSAAMRGHLGDSQLVDREGNRIDPVEQFPQHIVDILALLSPAGASFPVRGGQHVMHASPRVDDMAEVWLLGSSGYSAQLAAALGLPYVFANHFAGRGTAAAIQLYRDLFEPSSHGDSPRTFVTVNAAVGATTKEAWELVQPHVYQMGQLRLGSKLEAQRLVGEDVESVMTDGHRRVGESMWDTWAVGTAAEVADRLREIAAEYDVDEIMIQPIAGAGEDDPLDTAPARVRTVEALAGEFGLERS
ncbi:LLM class flavin-dependent oxidoreductase [Brevibacterium yomogidense]|uniref:LLM class flavin-dependent oxidoreductase n=1 Tax=Brevibacterium yomogidense TaxID=946573 RepID=UPI0018DFEAB6|nr:LLM class flavin-dependent oxidoreductase [Brevibacterium yomogidense]